MLAALDSGGELRRPWASSETCHGGRVMKDSVMKDSVVKDSVVKDSVIGDVS